MQHYDIAIVGGGLVGASFARAIANLGLQVVIIDRAPAQHLYNSSLDNRGLAIAYTTKQVLEQLEVWKQLEDKAFPITDVHVSEQKCFGHTHLTAQQLHIPALGYVISASQLGHALVHDLEKLPNLTVLRPVTISNLNYSNITGDWTLQVADKTISAKLLIAADGTNSMARKVQAIPLNSKDFAQTAIVTNIKIHAKNISIAFERFTNLGVLALLPFGTQQMKCIWTVDNANLAELTKLTDAEFLARVQQAIGFRAGKLLGVEARQIFPIQFAYATQVYGASLALIGNAANTLHPVAAQGFNLGIRDAMTLAKILQQAIQMQIPINSPVTLKKYANLREYDHNKTRNFSNDLVEIFAQTMPGVGLARSVGLVAAQLLPNVKRKIIAQGIGLWM